MTEDHLCFYSNLNGTPNVIKSIKSHTISEIIIFDPPLSWEPIFFFDDFEENFTDLPFSWNAAQP